MVEKLINIIINELNKHNIQKFCLLASYMFNQGFPSSENVKGFLNIGEIYCLHVWIRCNNKMYDIGHELFMRNYDYAKYLTTPQYSIEKPNHIENFDDNYEKFFSQLQNFDPKSYYNNAPNNVKKCFKAVKRKYAKISHCFEI